MKQPSSKARKAQTPGVSKRSASLMRTPMTPCSVARKHAMELYGSVLSGDRDVEIKTEPVEDVHGNFLGTGVHLPDASMALRREQTKPNFAPEGHAHRLSSSPLRMAQMPERGLRAGDGDAAQDTATHAGAVDVTYRILHQLPPDHQIYASAIETLIKEQLSGLTTTQLAPQAAFVANHLARFPLEETKIAQAEDLLQKALTPHVVKWLYGSVKDRVVLRQACENVLKSLQDDQHAAEVSDIPRGPKKLASHKMSEEQTQQPAEPVKSRSKQKNEPFKIEAYRVREWSMRKRLVRIFFPYAHKLFSYYAFPATPTYGGKAQTAPPDEWQQLGAENRGAWQRLLSDLHNEAPADVFQERAMELIAKHRPTHKRFSGSPMTR